MLSAFVLVAALLLAAAAAWYLRWLLQSNDEEETEETVWFDIREWGFLDRLFGPKRASLTYDPTSTIDPEDPR